MATPFVLLRSSNHLLEHVCELDRRSTIRVPGFQNPSAEEGLNSDFHPKGVCSPGPDYSQNDRVYLFQYLISLGCWQRGRPGLRSQFQRIPPPGKCASTNPAHSFYSLRVHSDDRLHCQDRHLLSQPYENLLSPEL